MKNLTPIICVDDDQNVLLSLKHQLMLRLENKVVVFCAESANEGLELVNDLRARNDKQIILVADIIMPDSDGLEFVKDAKRISPLLRAIVLSGFCDEVKCERMRLSGHLDAVLAKPWEEHELISHIELLISN